MGFLDESFTCLSENNLQYQLAKSETESSAVRCFISVGAKKVRSRENQELGRSVPGKSWSIGKVSVGKNNAGCFSDSIQAE